MNINFRNLKTEELEVRVQQVNAGGVQLLLYKDARADMNVLDDTVGPLGWKKSYSRDNANCTVSIYNEETHEWVSKEDTGTAANAQVEKSIASDSFKRACTCWGIGRNLYNTPSMFVFKKYLPGHKMISSGGKDRAVCNDTFKLKDVIYSTDGRAVINVIVEIYSNYKCVGTICFTPNGSKFSEGKATPTSYTSSAATQSSSKPETNVEKPKATKQTTNSSSAEVKESKEAPKATPNADTNNSDELFSDDEVFLLGPAVNKTYGEIKGTPEFNILVKWSKGKSLGYGGEKDVQLAKLQKLSA